MKKVLISLFVGLCLISPCLFTLHSALADVNPDQTTINEQCANNPLACFSDSEHTSSGTKAPDVILPATPNPAGNETSESGGFWSDLWDNLFGNKGQGQNDAYGQLATSSSILGLLAFLLNVALGLVGILMLMSLVYGGFLWMTALGEQAQIEKAKKIVMYTAIGFIVILSSFAIVNTLFGFQNLASLRLRFDVVNTIKSFF